MVNILDEIMKFIPNKSDISDSYFEGANIILYTKNRDLFINNNGLIKDIVNNIKKRVELRCDPSILEGEEKTKKIIEELIPAEAGLSEIIFDKQRSMIIIEADKPGLVIGKGGGLLKEIRQKTFWVPIIRRNPPIKSQLVENIRKVLYENNDYRKKFLHAIGKRIYDGWIREKKHEWVRITFLGGAREVGRSCLFLQTPESRIILDCGFNVAASGENAYPYLDVPEFDIEELDAVILCHPHIDHVGFLGYLYKYGFKGPTYCTEPTRDVSALLALDLLNIAHKEAKKALYNSTNIKDFVKHSVCLDYREVTDITPDVRLTFYNAGHNIGSAMAHLHIGNGLHNLLYTSDMNYEITNLLSPAVTKFPRLETLIIESTYGHREDIFPTRKECEDYLIDIIKKTIENGGKVLLPVLGVGRSQEILLILEKAIREGILNKIPIFIQGMVWDVTAIHTAYPEFFNNKVKKDIFHKDQNPFLADVFKRIVGRKEMMQIVDEEGPCVIVATSGMLTGGASLEYFKHLSENPKNSLVLTCYQGQGSLGRRLEDGEREIMDNDTKTLIKIKMAIHTIRGFSGHSNYQQLINFVGRLDPRPKKILCNHGESSKCVELASTIHRMFGIETSAPKNLEAIRLK